MTVWGAKDAVANASRNSDRQRRQDAARREDGGREDNQSAAAAHAGRGSRRV